MKKIVALFLTFLCLLSIVACDTELFDTDTSSSESTDTTPLETTEETESESMTEAVCEHDFSPATCNVPKTCKLCGKKEGTRLAHEPGKVTCTEPTLCLVCGGIVKHKTGHTYEGKSCVRCGHTPTWVACVGDSITAGGYWKLIKDYMPKNDYQIHGFGVSGTTGLVAGLDGWPEVRPFAYVNQPAHQEAKDSNADVYVIMLGTNDSKEMNARKIREDGGAQYKADMIAQVKEYQSLDSKPQVFIALPPVSYRSEVPETEWNMRNTNIENLIIPILKSVAEETGAIVIDTHEATKGKSSAFSDGVHPNEEGQAILAKTVAEGILAANKSSDN